MLGLWKTLVDEATPPRVREARMGIDQSIVQNLGGLGGLLDWGLGINRGK